MHDDSCGLIYDDYLVIFEHNIDRKIFRNEFSGWRGSEFNFELIVGAQFVRGFGRRSVNEDRLILDQSLQAGSAPALDVTCEKGIKAFTGLFLSNRKS